MQNSNSPAGEARRKLDESFGQITDRTNQSDCANQDADLMEDGISNECHRGQTE